VRRAAAAGAIAAVLVNPDERLGEARA